MKKEQEFAQSMAFVGPTKSATGERETTRGELPPLEKELVLYHGEYKPLTRADYVFLRYESR